MRIPNPLIGVEVKHTKAALVNLLFRVMMDCSKSRCKRNSQLVSCGINKRRDLEKGIAITDKYKPTIAWTSLLKTTVMHASVQLVGFSDSGENEQLSAASSSGSCQFVIEFSERSTLLPGLKARKEGTPAKALLALLHLAQVHTNCT